MNCAARCLRILVIAVALASVGCATKTVTTQPVTQKVIAFDESQQHAGLIDCDQRGCLVTRGWMERYKKMEAEFKVTVPGDAVIVKEGSNWRVPAEVAVHYAQMRSAQRGGP